MRILLVAQWYSPIIGGEESHVRNLAIGLSERGHEVSVATLVQPGQASGTEVQDGIRVHRVAGLVQRVGALFSLERRSAQPLPDPGIMLGLAAIIRRERPDVIHAHNWIVHSLAPLKRWSGAGLVLTLHDYSLICAKKTLVRTTADGDRLCEGPALGKCLRCASHRYGTTKAIPTVLSLFGMQPWEIGSVDAFVAVSDAVAEWNGLAQIGRPFHVIPNFVTGAHGRSGRDLDRWTQLLPAEPYLLFVGAFARAKGIEVLLRAWGGADRLPPLVLIGYQTQDQIVELRHSVPRLSVVVDWPQDAVMEAWRRSMAGVVPSIWRDPCPTVVIEAMLAGKPVIASSIGGLVDLVAEDVSGLLVPPGDSQALRRAMEGLSGDARLRGRLSTGAAARAHEFSGEVVIPRLEAVYESVRHRRYLS
jgi:glycosyltransferase involved in cell wall biosynthesis